MKMIFDLDLDKCCACGACAIACMDQNDVEIEEESPLRRIFTVETHICPLHACTVRMLPVSLPVLWDACKRMKMALPYTTTQTVLAAIAVRWPAPLELLLMTGSAK